MAAAEGGYRERVGKSRLEALSDGIFAFAMTLLVLSINLPQVSEADAQALIPGMILKLHTQFLLFVIAFFVLAGYWLSHHRIMHQVTFVDDMLIRLNILFLFFIVLIPFTTSVSGDYTGVLAAVLLFHANLLVTSLILVAIGAYISKHSADLAPERNYAEEGREHGVIISAIALLAIGVAFIDTYSSMWCYALIPVVAFGIKYYTARWRTRKPHN
jgi:uncharacterized membrane protein